MAVTLTSTGITFSDGTAQNSAAGGGFTGGKQVFTASGTWTRPAGVTQALVSMVGGGGRGGCRNNWQYKTGGNGGTGRPGQLLTPVNGNYTITVGAGGAGAANVSSINGLAGGAGGSTTGFGLTAGGGAGGNGGQHYGNGNPGASGTSIAYGNSVGTGGISGGVGGGATTSNNGANSASSGTAGMAFINW